MRFAALALLLVLTACTKPPKPTPSLEVIKFIKPHYECALTNASGKILAEWKARDDNTCSIEDRPLPEYTCPHPVTCWPDKDGSLWSYVDTATGECVCASGPEWKFSPGVNGSPGHTEAKP